MARSLLRLGPPSRRLSMLLAGGHGSELLRRACLSSTTTTSTTAAEDGRRRRRGDPATVGEDRAYCVNLVRERDLEGYFCGLLMPAASRDAYFALRAVNAELASVKDGQVMRFRGQQQSSSRQQQEESSLALKMRMQWWRDAVAEICLDDDEKKRQSTKKQNLSPEAVLLSNLSISRWSSPAVRSLDRAHQQCGGFTKRFLERLIDARETDLDVVQHATVEEAVQYAEDTVGSLLYLTLETVGVRDDQADEVASHAGKAIGLITALRSTPFRLQHGEIPIPFELLRPNFPVHLLLDEEAQLSEEDAQMLKEAVQHMASMAWEHALIAREMQGQIPAAAKPCLLPLVPSLHYLGRLRRADYDLFHSKLLQDPSARWKLLLLLGRTWLTGVL